MRRPWTSLRRFLSFPSHSRTIVRRHPATQFLRLENLEDRITPTIVFEPFFGAEPTTYNGGPVLGDTPVYLLYWGSYWTTSGGAAQESQLTTAIQNELNSPIYNRLGVSYGAGPAYVANTWNANETGDPANFFSDASLQNAVTGAINDLSSPILSPIQEEANDGGNPPIYLVITPPGINSGYGSGTLGYHSEYNANFYDGNADAIYGWSNSGNSSLPNYSTQDLVTLVASHELGEAMTDPAAFTGLQNNGYTMTPGASWPYGFGTGEIGDFEPEFEPNPSGSYTSYEYRINGSLTQALWDNNDSAFTVSDGTAQNFYINPQYQFNGSFYVYDGNTLNLYGDQFGSGYNDNITINTTSYDGDVQVTMNGETATFEPGQITAINVYAGGGSNNINVYGTPFGVTTDIVSGGSDTVTLGNGSTQSILGDVNIENPPSFNNIIVNDSSDSLSHTVTLSNIGANPADSQGNSDPWGQISGLLGSGNINYEYTDTRNVTVETGTASNTIDVYATGGIGSTNIVTGAPTNVTTTINVGNGTVSGIASTLNIESPPGYNTININDGSDTTARTVTLSNIGANPNDSQGNSDPWGQVSGLGGAAINYEYYDTTSLTINGPHAGSTYNIQATDAASTSLVTTINGGAGNDTFNVGSSNSLGGILGALTVNGGGGTNTLNANDSASASGQSYTLSSTKLGGSDFATITYASMHTLNVTGSGNDTLTILTPVPTTTTNFNGGSGTNTLVGPNASTTWTISGANSGKVDSVVFSHFQNLTGGSANDTFNFTSSAASVSGVLNGGGGTGNKISYSTLGSSFLVNVTLTSNNSGTAPLLANPFVNINSVAGSTDTVNTLTAPNSTNNWTISGANAGSVNTGPATAFAFTGMAHLVGGNQVDVFKLNGTSSTVLSINGGGAPAGKGDWLNYSGFPSSSTVTVNLATGSATNVNSGAAGAVTNIQNVIGSSSGTNNLTGDAQGNILIGGTGLNTIVGGSGNSLLIGGGGAGHGTITGGSGEDILIAGSVTFNATTTAGQNSLMAILAELQSADTFATKVNDIIHGGGLNGSNKLVWGGASATVHASTGAFTLKGDTSASSNPDWFFSASPSTVTDFNDDGVNDEHNNNAIGVF